MTKVTLCLCIDKNRVLLGMKKRGFGAGNWNGFGGKVEDETVLECAVRELQDESNLVAQEQDLELAAILNFHFDSVHAFECHVFLLRSWVGEPGETEEMRPQWFASDELPFDTMWKADRIWIPMILDGRKILGHIYFDKATNALLDSTFEDMA